MNIKETLDSMDEVLSFELKVDHINIVCKEAKCIEVNRILKRRLPGIFKVYGVKVVDLGALNEKNG